MPASPGFKSRRPHSFYALWGLGCERYLAVSMHSHLGVESGEEEEEDNTKVC